MLSPHGGRAAAFDGVCGGCISVVEDPSKEEIKKHYGLLRDKKDLPVIVGAKRENCERKPF